MKRFTLISLVSIMLLAFAATAMADPPVVCQSTKVQSFDFLLDYSGSMMMFHKHKAENKFKLAKEALRRVNDRIPELGYTGSIHTFATNREVVKQQTYNRAVFQKGFNSLNQTYEVFARLTPMGNGIAHWTKALYASLPSPTAVIIVSDGENNRGVDPLSAAQAAIAANPGLVFHVISLADSPAGEATLQAIVNLRPKEGVYVRAENIIDHDIVADGFVTEVFCATGRIVLRSVQFALGSAEITRESAAILNELANILKGSAAHVEVNGHTCSIGSDESNQRLSERRAASVKHYLTTKGIPAASIATRGFGEMQPKFDNSTDEGRRLNRRAEIDFNRRQNIDFNYNRADIDFK
ncbi:MAG: OmpA family protein [Desulfovibrio sp.]|jgi:OOP family OmpA-OmpF porin|nr:OmpA family protein [Desulfovibrio sp.]